MTVTEQENSDLNARLTALEKLFEERELRYRERWQSQEQAGRVFRESLDAWKATANEWRGAMEDRERNFFPKNLGLIIGLLTLIMLAVQLFTTIKGG